MDRVMEEAMLELDLDCIGADRGNLEQAISNKRFYPKGHQSQLDMVLQASRRLLACMYMPFHSSDIAERNADHRTADSHL